MRRVSDHISHVRAQPHRVRRSVALGLAGLAAGAIGVVWLGISLATGSFAIEGNGFAQATGAEPFNTTGGGNDVSSAGLAGAAAAGDPAQAQGPARLDVAPDAGSPAPSGDQAGSAPSQAAIIPF